MSVSDGFSPFLFLYPYLIFPFYSVNYGFFLSQIYFLHFLLLLFSPHSLNSVPYRNLIFFIIFGNSTILLGYLKKCFYWKNRNSKAKITLPSLFFTYFFLVLDWFQLRSRKQKIHVKSFLQFRHHIFTSLIIEITWEVKKLTRNVRTNI